MEKGKVTTTQRRNAQRKRRAEEISKSTTNDANLDNNLTLTSPQSLRPRPPNNETEQEELDTLDLKEWETCALKAFTNLFHENGDKKPG